MRLSPNEVKAALMRKGVTHLYHANSVKTACTFLQVGGLLSRGVVERKGLDQSWQPSDDIDRQVGVWNDIFFDAVDIGARTGSYNKYGPVLFVFNLDILDTIDPPELWVTRSNPIHWHQQLSSSDRYFVSATDFAQLYNIGDFGSMFTLRNTTDVLPFGAHLERIILDDPQRCIRNATILGLQQTLQEIINRRGVRTNLIVRANIDYSRMSENSIQRLFLP